MLPSISKTINNNILYQIYQYFQENSLLSNNQYGFRKGHSTELASLALVESIIKDLDNNLLPISIFLDLSKAFDTIDHNILVSKLSYYGFNNKSTDLIKNYLHARTQYVSYDNTSSKFQKLSTGVPQGSVLGPLLFLIYINDISNASSLFRVLSYADDTTLTSSFNLSNVADNLVNINH